MKLPSFRNQAKKLFVYASAVLGFASSVLAVSLFIAPVLRPVFFYTDEEFLTDMREIRDEFYIKQAHPSDILPKIDMVIGRRKDREALLMRFALNVENENIADAKSDFNQAFGNSARANARSAAHSDIRILKNYYEFALSMAPSSGKDALHMAMLWSPDTKSLVAGANLTAEKAASTIRHLENPWLFYPLMGRGSDYALLLAAGDEIVRNTPDFAWGYAIRARSNFTAINDSFARVNLKVTLAELQERIVRDVEIALALAPDMASAYYLRARVEEDLGQYQDAEFDYNRAVLLQPDYCEARLSRGVLFSKMDRDEEALEDATEVINRCPNLLQAYQNRASVLRRLQRYDAAVLDFSFVYENASGNLKYHALNDRAATQMETNFWHQGCNDYEELEKIGTRDGGLNLISANFGLAQCAERRDDASLAVYHYFVVVEQFSREYSSRAAFAAVRAAYNNKPFELTQTGSDLLEKIRLDAARLRQLEESRRRHWNLLLSTVDYFETLSMDKANLEHLSKKLTTMEPMAVAFVKFGLSSRLDADHSDTVQGLLAQVDDLALRDRELVRFLIQLEDAFADSE